MASEEEINFILKGTPDGLRPVFVFLPDKPPSIKNPEHFFSSENGEVVSLVLSSALPAGDLVEQYAERALKAIAKHGVKRATLVGLGAGGALAQAMTIRNRKLCRRLVLIESSCRLRPSRVQLIFDKVESLLPFGLPFRIGSGDFDSRPYLHRIDCPTLVITGHQSSRFELRQARFFESRLPNSWYTKFNGLVIESEGQINPKLASIIEEFYRMPTKRPQKKVKSLVSDLPLAS